MQQIEYITARLKKLEIQKQPLQLHVYWGSAKKRKYLVKALRSKGATIISARKYNIFSEKKLDVVKDIDSANTNMIVIDGYDNLDDQSYEATLRHLDKGGSLVTLYDRKGKRNVSNREAKNPLETYSDLLLPKMPKMFDEDYFQIDPTDWLNLCRNYGEIMLTAHILAMRHKSRGEVRWPIPFDLTDLINGRVGVDVYAAELCSNKVVRRVIQYYLRRVSADDVFTTQNVRRGKLIFERFDIECYDEFQIRGFLEVILTEYVYLLNAMGREC